MEEIIPIISWLLVLVNSLVYTLGSVESSSYSIANNKVSSKRVGQPWLDNQVTIRSIKKGQGGKGAGFFDDPTAQEMT